MFVGGFEGFTPARADRCMSIGLLGPTGFQQINWRFQIDYLDVQSAQNSGSGKAGVFGLPRLGCGAPRPSKAESRGNFSAGVLRGRILIVRRRPARTHSPRRRCSRRLHLSSRSFSPFSNCSYFNYGTACLTGLLLFISQQWHPNSKRGMWCFL